ncbi:glycosyltransferase family 4 protein [Thalassotalea sp. G20_0]|uniref:glycosyltransferase family 4 protein n=1 Tax=Thalassotalea sp. G20_0 TaxID=2821093 RepID=UPI001ADC3577|nr:glycosyltransferase family 4 protein [Thalassotalea sp. G20_0]MBO9493578.1 glycosyltransferase family 4 protein [Thalassotalea sp. G20_0]
MKTKVAIIGTTAQTLLVFRADLIKQLIKEGITVFAFAMDYDELTMERVRKLGATPVSYSLSRYGLNPLTDLIHTWQLSCRLRELQIDVVFSYFSKPVIFGSLAARFAGVKRCVGMLEGLGYTFTPTKKISFKRWFAKRVQVFLYRCMLSELDRVIFLNGDDQHELLENYSIKAKDTLILGGIGLDLSNYCYSPPPKAPFRFIFIGRLLEEKGIHFYLDAAQAIKQSYPRVVFTILGQMEKKASSKKLAKRVLQYQTDGIVEFPGQVDNVVEWLTNASVFVLPSYREGFPRSTQEAMAIGRPAITTNVPGCRHSVLDGVTGFVVEINDVQALIDKMLWFIENPEAVESMGRAGREFAELHYDADKINTRLIQAIFDN